MLPGGGCPLGSGVNTGMPMFLHYLSSSCCVGCVMDKHPTSCCEEEGHMGGDMESSFTRCTPTGSCPLSSFFLLKWKYKMKILTFALFCFPVIFFQPRRPTESWATSKEVWPARSGRGLSPSALSLWGLIWSAASRKHKKAQGRHGAAGADPEKGHKDYQTAGAPPVNTDWGSWACSF